MINREILIRSKIKSYDEFLEAFKYIDENDLIVIITKDYVNDERKNLRDWFYKAKNENIKPINEYSDSEIEYITCVKINDGMRFEKYDIVKFYGINDFIEIGIIKEVDNDYEIYEIQTLDKKSILYNGEYKIIEKVGNDKNFDFSNEKFHNFKIGQKFKLKFTKEFLQDYTNFYHDNFGKGIDEQLKEFQDDFKMNIGNIYDLEIFAYNGRYSYCCKLNNVKSFYTFIIHEDLIKKHEVQ